jgi:hypothetical protein
MRRVFTALETGDTDAYYTMYDGAQLFSNSHLVGADGRPWDNLLAGTGVTATTLKADLQSAINQFNRIPWGPGNQFMPIEGARFTVIAPKELELAFREVLYNKQNPDATYNTENVWSGLADLFTTNLLNDTNNWYLLMDIAGTKPFIHLRHTTQSSRRLISEIEPGSQADLHDQYRWWVKTFEEVFPNQYWLLLKVLNTGGSL